MVIVIARSVATKQSSDLKKVENMKQGYVYILFNERNGTLYTGVTSNLIKRIWQHREGVVKGFTKKYGTHQLGYYEIHSSIKDAIAREKQIKGGSRKDKLNLIQDKNPYWNDLYEEIV